MRGTNKFVGNSVTHENSLAAGVGTGATLRLAFSLPVANCDAILYRELKSFFKYLAKLAIYIILC